MTTAINRAAERAQTQIDTLRNAHPELTVDTLIMLAIDLGAAHGYEELLGDFRTEPPREGRGRQMNDLRLPDYLPQEVIIAPGEQYDPEWTQTTDSREHGNTRQQGDA